MRFAKAHLGKLAVGGPMRTIENELKFPLPKPSLGATFGCTQKWFPVDEEKAIQFPPKNVEGDDRETIKREEGEE